MVSNTTKPMVMTAAGVGDLEVMWRIACGLPRRRRSSCARSRTSPVRRASQPAAARPRGARQAALLRRLGHPAHLLARRRSPAPRRRSPTPATSCQAVAESLFGARHPPAARARRSAAHRHGPGQARHEHRRSARTTRPSTTRPILGITEMAKWMDIPNWGYAGTSDSQCRGRQRRHRHHRAHAALHAGRLQPEPRHRLPRLRPHRRRRARRASPTRSSRSTGARSRASRSTTRRWRWTSSPPSATAATSSASSTPRACASLQWRPTILNRDTQKNWEADGSPDATEKAHASSSTS